jgi:hypothetical protein
MKRSFQKVPLRWLQGDSKIPLGPFLSSARKAINTLLL